MKTKLYFATLICALGLPLFTACSDDDEVFGTPNIRQPLPREVGVTGKVITDAGAPLADVVVSDGINLTTTDAEGQLRAPVRNGTRLYLRVHPPAATNQQ